MAGNYTTLPQQITNDVAVHTGPSASPNPGDFGAGAGMGALGQGVQQFASAVAQTDIEQKERAAMAWSAQAVGQAHSDMLQHMEDQKNSAQPGAPGFTQNFAKTFDDYAGQLVQNAPSLAAKQFAMDRMGYLRARMVDSAQYFEQNERTAYQVAQFEDGIKSATNAAVMDPTQLPTLMRTMQATYENAGMPPSMKRKLDEAVQQMPLAVMDAQVEKNPAQARAVLGQSLGLSGASGQMYGNGSASSPLGMRNNNPGNIRVSDIAWQGKVGNDGQFEQFATPEAGVRAAMVNLRTSISVDGNDTLAKAISKWAPPNENNTAAYIADVSKKTGISPDATLNPNDKGQMSSVLSAIFQHENKGQTPAAGALATGIDAAYGDAKLPPGVAPGTGNDVPTGNFVVDAIPVAHRVALFAKANAQMEKQNTQMRQQLEQQVQDDSAQAMNGVPVANKATMGQFTQAFGDVEGPLKYKEYNARLQTGQAIQNMAGQTPQQMDETLRQLQPQPGAGFAVEQEQYQHAMAAAQHIVEWQQKDPQGYAQSNGLVPKQTLNLQDPAATTQALSSQIAAAHVMTDKYQAPFRPLTIDQAKWLGASLSTVDPNTAVNTLQTIIRGAHGNPDDAMAVLSQIKETSPVMAKAGEILTHGDNHDVAVQLIQGDRLLKNKGAQMEYVGKPEAFGQAFDNATAGAYAGSPQTRAQDLQAVQAYYAQQQATMGASGANGVNNALLKQSIQSVIGNVSNVGGMRTIMPHGVDPDRFDSAMSAAWPSVMKSYGIDPENMPLRGATFQRLSDGEYAVMNGNGPLKRPGSNEPVFVHFNDMTVQPGLKNHPSFRIPMTVQQPMTNGASDE